MRRLLRDQGGIIKRKELQERVEKKELCKKKIIQGGDMKTIDKVQLRKS